MMKTAIALGALSIIVSACPGFACDVEDSYVARLSEMDHFNSRGVRLTSAAAIVRQDRANFHLFGKRDQEDRSDRFFASKDNREALERLIERGQSAPNALTQIVNGTPIIEVVVCRSAEGYFVNVTVY